MTKIKPNLILASLLEPLFYFDIFSHPLTADEILYYCNLQNGDELSKDKLLYLLEDFVQKESIYKIENYYLLNKNAAWVEQRKVNNLRAESSWKTASKMTRLMRYFPYVRAVFISGSLSKNVMQKDGDIDYFIVTKPNRLWIARTCLILFKKIFLLNSFKYFCVNYLVDEELLEIEEKNRFTATEIATLQPLYGEEIYQSFWKANRWIVDYYPNAKASEREVVLPTKQPLFQRLIEFFFNGTIGAWLDEFFMKKTIKHWDKKFGKKMTQQDFDIALKSRRNISKHHPNLFQQKVLKAFDERVLQFEEKHQIALRK